MSKWSSTKLSHSRNTRRSGELSVPRCRLSAGQRGFYFRGAKRWSDLPQDLQNIKDIKVFKKGLFNCIFNEYIALVGISISNLLFNSCC